MALRPGCPLCDEPGGQLIVQTPQLRVIRAAEAGFPAFYRVVWQQHVAELSELSRAERQTCMDAVVAVEQALRRHLRPTKINLAALGNMVPHLHWHVIARFDWDSHYPAPVWAAKREGGDGVPEERLAAVTAALAAVEVDVVAALGQR